MPLRIPFVKPFLAGNELKYAAEVVRSGKLDSDGPFTRACAALLESRFGLAKVLMTPSCTAALEMAAMLCGLSVGDEVIMPSFTFVSTANAVALRGARPVFIDIRQDTLNLDERRVEQAITPRTKAIFAVHYAGVACEMDQLASIAAKHKLILVEDAAQAVNAAYHGRPLGGIGHLGAYSFHVTKNYACGEGGALVINDPAMIERAEILREKGTNRSKFFRGEVDKYTWVDVGSSYLPSELACAVLLGQLEQIDAIQARRREVCEMYRQGLAPLEDEGKLRLPIAPAHCSDNGHMFYAIANDGNTRDALLAHLKSQGIGAVFHYVPLHSSPVGERFGYRHDDLPATEAASARLLRLPLYCDLSAAEQAAIIEQVFAFFRDH
jgi:dTDP-4-amino-4,6-dideoxygalactose transaminase